jgi:sigma-B regulation protein RsbU (phosphoserine phosphatase)
VKNRLNFAEMTQIHQILIIFVYKKPMNAAVISQVTRPEKTYPNTLQKLAKYFWQTGESENVIAFADELELNPGIPVVCVTDSNYRPLGIVRRDQLFLSLGKRFGREVMAKDTLRDITEKAPVYSGETNILVVLARFREYFSKKNTNTENEFIVLTDSSGSFCGMLSMGDVSNYTVEMTNTDIAAASLLQERFLANADTVNEHKVTVDSWSLPAKGIGGDFYFIKKLDDTRFFASLCDVSGKGVAAALVVSMAWGFLRGYTIQRGLRDLLASLNASIVSSFHMEKYMTGFFLIYDSASRQLYVADMGHAHAVFLRNGKIVSMEKTRVNLPIGVETTIDPCICAIGVQSGDTLLIYSDGITEQDNPAGEEFGEERLLLLTKKTISRNAALSEALPKMLDDFRLHTPQHDDMTFLMFRF